MFWVRNASRKSESSPHDCRQCDSQGCIHWYEMLLWSYLDDFVSSMPVCIHITKRGHLWSIPLEQLCTWTNDVATVGNIFFILWCGMAFIFFFVFSVLKSSSLWGRLFLETARRWVFRCCTRLLGQKLHDIERLVSYRIFIVENPITWPNFRRLTHSFTIPLQHFHVINLVECLALTEWIQSQQYLYVEESDEHGFIRDFYMRAFLDRGHAGWVVSIANFVFCFQDHIERTVFHLQW